MASINNQFYQPLADITVNQNKLIYCKKHNYIPYFKNKNWHTNLDEGHQPNTHNLGFEKIATIIEIMDIYKSVDLIWFTDCDSLITNMTIKIEDVWNKYQTEDCLFMASEDGNNLNVGSMLVRCSQKAFDYCKFIYNQKEAYKDKSWNEQQVIIDTHKQYPGALVLIPQKEINSYDYSTYEQHQFKTPLNQLPSWSNGDLLISWPGKSLDERLNLANRYMKEVIQ